MNKISISTNVTSQDAPRILKVLPNWLKVFGNNIHEILIVHDKKPIEGRIKELHKNLNKVRYIEFYCDEILGLDKRIRIIDLDYNNSSEILNRWFYGNEKPIRCQAGTPIYAFIYAIEKAQSDFILKVDCDMVFFNNGFVEKIIGAYSSNKFDVGEVSKTGSNNPHKGFSTRSFFVNRKSFYEKLPMTAHKLDILRRIHRKFNRRPSYLSLEEIIKIEIEKNRFISVVLPVELGYSMHISTIEEMNLPKICKIIEMFGNGLIPPKQISGSENFSIYFWENYQAQL